MPAAVVFGTAWAAANAGLAFAWNAGVFLAASAAASAISRSMMDKPRQPQDLSGGVQLQNARTTDWNLPLLYGACRVGINQVYIGSSGANNRYLHIVGILGEGPIRSIVGANDNGHTTSVGSPNAYVFLDDKHFSEYGSDVYWEFYNGTATQQASAFLTSEVPAWIDALRYTAYLYLRLSWAEDRWNGVPRVTASLYGLECYNPLSGLPDYYNNPAMCAYDMLTRPSVRGGMGLDTWYGPVPSSPRINLQALSDLYEYAGTHSWTCNMPIINNTAFMDNLDSVLANCRGGITYSETTHKFTFMDIGSEAVAMSFDEDTIVDAGGVSSLNVNLPDSFDRPNAVRIKYLTQNADPNGANSYQTAEYLKVDSAAVAADGDQREKVIECYGLSDLARVQQMANYFLERLRWNKNVTLVAGTRAMVLEPYDLIQISFDAYGWEDKLFRVMQISYNPDATVAIAAIEEDATFYDNTYNAIEEDFYKTTLPNINADVPNVTNAEITEELYFYRLRSFSRLKVDFDPPDATVYPWWDYAEIWVALGSDTDYRYMTRCETDYMIDPVEEGDYYHVKIRGVSVAGKKESLDTCVHLSHMVLGKLAAPSDLTGLTAIAHGDVVSIFANPVDDPDVEGYEVRLGDSWAGGIFIYFGKNPSVHLNGVRPGVHTFWMSPKDNSGNYSETPVSATVKVFVPPGYTELATYGSWSWDFTDGTYDNSAPTVYDSKDSLIALHNDSVMTGIYTSPVYDLGAVRDVRLWGDFLSTFVAGTSTWNGRFVQDDVTWDDLLDDSTTWNSLFEPVAAAQLRATLAYSEDGSTYESVDWFEILVAEVSARYVAVGITITDPSDDAHLYLHELNMLAYTGPQDV